LSSRGLLVITAHPDDEVLIAGGTLAACRAASVPSAVVCLTRGEHGPIADPSLASRATLAAVRERELREACAELGVGYVRCYRRQDGNLRWSDASAIVRQLVRVIDSLRPEVVITFGEDGLYWHPDHIACWEFSVRAVRRASVPTSLYRSVWPEELAGEFVGELRRLGLPDDLWSIDPDLFGVGPEDRVGELAVDVRAFVGAKLRAIGRHRTQVGAGHALASLPDELAERFLGIERFVRAGDTGPERTLLDSLAAGVAAHA
jgi:LmbE family N-acetylglucosaminyl deacetylase